MTEKFRNKHRIASYRLSGYDYASDGAYFITIVTRHREHFFGEITGGEMVLNELGEMARDEWFKTPGIRPDMNLTMDEFVVMPNHIHGIIIIGKNKFNRGHKMAISRINNDRNNDCRDAMHGVSTRHGLNDKNDNNYKNKFAPQRKNLSSIIRGYKSAVTRKSRRIRPDFAWQPNYYDRVIRNERELNRIRVYIINNPQMWERDRNNREL